MKECRKCKAVIPSAVVIDGERKVLSSRKFCLDCSPWGNHNTRPDIDKPKRNRIYSEMNEEEKRTRNLEVYSYQKKRRFKKKKQFVLLLGGECQRCGYKENLSSLAFHHRNPEEKEFTLSARELGMYKEERLFKEVAKCDLLCHNCHGAEHNPSWSDWR